MHSMSKLEADGLQNWENRKYKTLPALMGFEFCCNIRRLRSEFGVNNHCFTSVVQAAAGGVMAWAIFSYHTLGPLVPTKHHLNSTAYLGIIANCPSLYDHSRSTF